MGQQQGKEKSGGGSGVEEIPAQNVLIANVEIRVEEELVDSELDTLIDECIQLQRLPGGGGEDPMQWQSVHLPAMSADSLKRATTTTTTSDEEEVVEISAGWQAVDLPPMSDDSLRRASQQSLVHQVITHEQAFVTVEQHHMSSSSSISTLEQPMDVYYQSEEIETTVVVAGVQEIQLPTAPVTFRHVQFTLPPVVATDDMDIDDNNAHVVVETMQVEYDDYGRYISMVVLSKAYLCCNGRAMKLISAS